MTLTGDERAQLEREGVVRVVVDGVDCVVMRADLFERMKLGLGSTGARPPTPDAWDGPASAIDIDDYVS